MVQKVLFRCTISVQKEKDMKKFYIAEACVIIALIVGIFIGKSLTNDRGYYKKYNLMAEEAYLKAKDANTPPATEEDPKRLERVMTLYREVFEKYRETGIRKGFLYVESGPQVRSSYHSERHVNVNKN